MINFKLNSNAWDQWILKMDFHLPFLVHFSMIEHQQNVVAIFIFNQLQLLLRTTNENFPLYYVPIWLSIIHHYLCQCQI